MLPITTLSQALSWHIAGELPGVQGEVNPGLAGAYSGIIHNKLLIAGGANFPEGMPWNGGKKKYHNEIYTFSYKQKHWQANDIFHLPKKMAYGATINTGSTLFFIGGETEQGITNEVWKLTWKKGIASPQLISLPPIPVPLTNLCAALHNNIIYVAGGETNGSITNSFYCYDTKNEKVRWQPLASLPLQVSHGVLIALEKNIYLIGGRKKTQTGISDLYKNVWKYNYEKKIWSACEPLPYALSAACGIAIERNELLLISGDTGETFHKVESLIAAIEKETNSSTKDSLLKEKATLHQNHPGFSNQVLKYNERLNHWETFATLPYPAPVTTLAIQWQKQIIVPSGEIKAGVRTPYILQSSLINKKN